MEHATVLSRPESAHESAPSSTKSAEASLPWQGWVAVASVACLPIGLLWDISWHSTIGRDTFWTPAHILIQLGGIVPATLFAWLAVQTIFGDRRKKTGGWVRIAGLEAPLGAWVTVWGAAAMVTSAPFDDWWHNTYGLDVQIVSPPHSILGAGMFAVTAGVLLFVFSRENRAQSKEPTRSSAILCALAAGVMLTLFSDFLTEFTFPNQQHSPAFYRITAAVYPLALVLTARASRLRWPATIAAATYMSVLMLMIWVLPLFPAEPKLAPIYNPVTHMVPPAFPLLLVLPGVGIDLFMRKFARGEDDGDADRGLPASPNGLPVNRPASWRLAAGLGAIFVALFLPTQWFFSQFLLSDAADNWFFARSGHWPYFVEPSEWWNRFWERRAHPFGVIDFIGVYAIAIVASRIGLWCGDYLRKVQR
jgi:hypothetical protein